MKTKLVVLDWAGTAVDYGCMAPVSAFERAFQYHALTPTIDEIRAPMGMLKRDHIRAMLAMGSLKDQWIARYSAEPDERAVERIYQVFERSLMESLADHAAPKPGTVETAAKLKDMGLFIGSTTGYTDSMMAVVVPRAAEQGYAPDAWFSPDAVDGMGRPYPYMIYANMQRFQIASIAEVVKVGDTIADIKEGKNAGVISLGVLEGSSEVGLSEEEYESLPAEKRQALLNKARRRFLESGADDVLESLKELPAWLEANA